MTSSSLGRRLGDWLGIVPEEEIAAPTAGARRRADPARPVDSPIVEPPIIDHGVIEHGVIEVPAAGTRPGPLTFRSAVNERRAAAVGAPPSRWAPRP